MKNYGKCQVCGCVSLPGRKNCSKHAHTQERMVPLAQWANKLQVAVSTIHIREAAERFNVPETTVRQHLKREGFAPIREWRNSNEK